jgi:hypothetical protein
MANNKLHSTRLVLVVMLMSLFCVFGVLSCSKTQKYDDDYVVKDLQVIDAPNDDGSGLEIRWKPLPTEKKVISYRIYRGTTTDTLFYIGEIGVNLNTVITDETVMVYNDKDYNAFVSVASPGKLKKEKGQSPDSPIYRAIPRDMKILGPMLTKYDLLGIIPNKQFYFKTKPVEQDGKVFAGVKTNQMTIMKKLIPDSTYYYTVLAIDSRRNFFPHAEPVAGKPVNNHPETPGNLYIVQVTDTNVLKFEWSSPLYGDDVRYFEILAVENADLYKDWHGKYQDWVAELNKLKTGQSEKTETELEQEFYKLGDLPATPIKRIPLPQPYTPTTFAEVEYKDNNILNADGEVIYTFKTDPKYYSFVLSYIDYTNLQSFSVPYQPHSGVLESDLPVLDHIFAFDRKNDKGDYLTFYWGKPFARINSVTYLNEERTRLQMSYEFATNEKYELKNIYFEILDENGNTIKLANNKEMPIVNEFFLDKVFKIRIPAEYDQKTLTVKMYFRTKSFGLDKDHFVTQKLIYDAAISTLRPQELYFNGVCLNDFNYQLLKKGRANANYRVSRKFPVFDRETPDVINFEANIFKQVANYDLKKNMILVDYNIDFVYDPETKSTIQTPMFESEKNNVIGNLNDTITEYNEKLNAAETDEEKAQWQMYVDYYNTQLDNQAKIMEHNERLKYVNSITSNNARARAIRKIRETEKRELNYQMFISDGKGLFSLSTPMTDMGGGIGTMSHKNPQNKEEASPYYMIPKGNWFDTSKGITLIASLIFALLVSVFVSLARKGKNLYIRPIAGIEEIDNAIGRATEMGRPILFCPGLSGIQDVATLAALSILGRVARKAAEYDTKILVPCRDYIVLPIAREIVREAHYEAGRPDSFDGNNVFFVSEQQFAYVAGVNGVMIREKTATNFYMGMFYAEALIMTETGSMTGAIQIAGTDAVTQIPFFITTCDYTLIGEELYAASAYMARQPLMLGTLKAQDYTKFLILTFMILGAVLSSFQVTTIIDLFPSK